MDSRRIELQLRAIVVTYRVERNRRDRATMRTFLERAHVLLDSVESEGGDDPDLKAAVADVRREIEGTDVASQSGGEKAAFSSPREPPAS